MCTHQTQHFITHRRAKAEAQTQKQFLLKKGGARAILWLSKAEAFSFRAKHNVKNGTRAHCQTS